MSRFEKITLVPPPKHELVRDTATGLTWAVAFSERLTFEQAEQYIAALNSRKHCGFDDWRLPTRVELLTLVDDARCDPAIDTDAFPGTPSEHFWTSTDYAGDRKNYSWVVDFGFGYASIGDRAYKNRIRAVRTA